MASLYSLGCLFWMSRLEPVVPVRFFLLPSPSDHFLRWLQGVPFFLFTMHTTFLPLILGLNLLTNFQTHAVSFLLPETGASSVTEKFFSVRGDRIFYFLFLVVATPHHPHHPLPALN